MLDAHLIPAKTVVTTKGEGMPLEITSLANRVVLLTLNITQIIEQESIDVSVWASADGATWGDKPVAVFPQKFYAGQHPMLLDLSARPDVRFLRAQWTVNRWGRGTETPMFEFNLAAREVPQEMLAAK